MGNIKYQYFDDGYSIIQIDRPEKRNAISKQMVDEFQSSLQMAMQDDIKFLVITGTGKTFSAGGDLNDFHGDLTPDEAFAHLYPMKEVLFDLVSFPVPTICLLNGDALGGGCEIATACDFRIAIESSSFGFVQSKLGITPGWGGGVLLYEKVHHTFAYQWLIDATVYEAPFLVGQGWLHHIVPVNEWDIDQILKPYMNKSIELMKTLKGQYKKSLASLGLSAQMSEEVRQCANLWGSEEHKQAIQRFLTK